MRFFFSFSKIYTPMKFNSFYFNYFALFTYDTKIKELDFSDLK